MAGAFGGAMAAPGECACCGGGGGPSNSCGNFPDIPTILNLSAGSAGIIFAPGDNPGAVTATLTYGSTPAPISGPITRNLTCPGGGLTTLPASSWYSPLRTATADPTYSYYIRFYISGCTARLEFYQSGTTVGGAGWFGWGNDWLYQMPLSFAGGHLPLTSFWSKVLCGSSSSFPVTISSGGGAGIPIVGTGVG